MPETFVHASEVRALSANVDSDRFRETMRQWVAGVTVITVGIPPYCHGMTANSFTPLSMSPPLMLICIDRNNDTHKFLKVGSRFGVNLLSESQVDLSARFASKSAVGGGFEHKITGDCPWDAGPHGTMLFRGCAAVMEVEVLRLCDGGDHTIFIGNILWAEADPHRQTLVYSRGAYGGWSPFSEAAVRRGAVGPRG